MGKQFPKTQEACCAMIHCFTLWLQESLVMLASYFHSLTHQFPVGCKLYSLSFHFHWCYPISCSVRTIECKYISGAIFLKWGWLGIGGPLRAQLFRLVRKALLHPNMSC